MAYALQSLITVLENILNPQQTLWIVDHNKPQLQSLLQKATSLQQILDKSPLTKIESLESQIRDAAHEAEDIIESHMVDQMLSPVVPGMGKTTLAHAWTAVLAALLSRLRRIIYGEEFEAEPYMENRMLSNPEAVRFTFSTPDLQPVMQQLDSAMEQVVKLVEVKTGSLSGTSFSCNVDSVRPKAVVGVDGDLVQLRDRLSADQKKLEIVPIVGMGGIGKTTLARKLYEDPSIVYHFKYHAWATVSQNYDMKAILLSLLHSICGKEESDRHAGKESDELKVILYRSLCGKRYMVVLDDIWIIKFWDEIRKYFPDDNKGSRIVITTRESEVAEHVSSRSVQHQMKLLEESESWTLLCQEVFGDEEDCPDELQGIGEKISRDCGGLPLAINVMGGLLSKVERSIGVWESIAKNVASAIAEADEQFSNILYLSYSHLPNHLKPCLLYMGAFPEDHKIEGFKLVLMWMAEGFVKSNGNKSLEEEAEGCLKALVERNLIFVSEYNRYAKPIYYSMHDLLRDLCIRKSNEDKFFYVVNNRMSIPRPMCVVKSSVRDDCQQLYRSFIAISRVLIEFESFRLLRVLDLINARLMWFPYEMLHLVNLRFLAIDCDSIGSGISRLKNLQTLIGFVDYCCKSPEIFAMSELRHLHLTISHQVHLKETIKIDEEDMKTIAPNKLQTLSRIIMTESLIRIGFLESIPDIKHLEIDCKYVGRFDLRHLLKLETLTIHHESWLHYAKDGLFGFKFPSGLRELVVHKHVMCPRAMTTLCALPNLEVLKMTRCEFAREGDDGYYYDGEWEVAEGDEFRSLQVLDIENSELVRWRANETNFLRLRHLCLDRCSHLEEIPSGIGEISTLELIELEDCRDSAVASARQIVEEQRDNGNYTLQLRIK